MKKTLLWSALGLFMAGAMIYGRSFPGMVRTCGNNLAEAVKAEHPLEFEIQRAKGMVQNLHPEMKECMTLIAQQQVKVEDLEAKVQDQQVAQETQKEILLKLTVDLENGEKNYVYKDETYSREEVEADRKLRWNNYQEAEARLNRDLKVLEATKKTLEANRNKLAQMQTAKRELEVQIVELEARLEMVKADEMAQETEFDDSELANARKVISDISTRVKVREKLANQDNSIKGQIPLEDKAEEEDLSTQIRSKFSGSKLIKTSPGDVISIEKAGSDSK